MAKKKTEAVAECVCAPIGWFAEFGNALLMIEWLVSR